MTKRTNKAPGKMDIFVLTGDQALPTGSMVTATTALNLANGQGGVISFDPTSAVKAVGNYLVAGDDSAEVTAIKVVRGTPKSNATHTVSLWEDGHLAKQESGIIRRGGVTAVAVKKATFGKLGGLCVSGIPTPASNSKYGAYLTLDSTNIDKNYGVNNNVIYADAPVTDFAVVTVTDRKDFVLQHIANRLNSQSRVCLGNGFANRGKHDFVVFGVKLAGGSGQVIGTVTPTTSISFDRRNGIDQVITLGEAGCVALADLVNADANLLATSTIEKLDVTVAGNAATIDALIVLGLERELAAGYDDQAQRMTGVTISLTDAFRVGATPLITRANAEDAVNTGRQWFNTWRLTAGLGVGFKQLRPTGDFLIEGFSYIDEAKRYTSYVVEYTDVDTTLTGDMLSKHTLVLLLPCEKLSTFVVNVNNIITRIAASNTPIPMITSNDAGTGTASANTVAGLEAVFSAWLEHSRATAKAFPVTGDAVAGGVYLS